MDFFKKKRLTVDEILKAIEALSDEDKQTLQDQLNEIYSDDSEEPEEEGDVPEEETEETSEEEQEETETETPTDEEAAPEAETPETEAPETLENDNSDQEWKTKIESELAQIKQLLTGLLRQPKQANETASSKLESLARKFE